MDKEKEDIISVEKDDLIHAKKKMPKWLKITLKSVIGVVILILAVVLIYFSYVLIDYHRIDDWQTLEIESNAEKDKVNINTEYTIVTQNMGFGAYTADFTFFMDGGKESRAKSADSVKWCFEQGMSLVNTYQPDFVLIQEVDLKSTRTFKINQKELIDNYFEDYDSNFAVNYDSPYLMYPLSCPHGKSYSSIVTYANVKMTEAIRRQLPISTSLSKLLDLDRCYSKTKIMVENGKELILYNVHLSAYGRSEEVREGQMRMLLGDMSEECNKGNYVICGGDFNHDFLGDSVKTINGDQDTSSFEWAYPFPIEMLDEYTGIIRAEAYNDGLILPTCRNCDIPYVEGNFTIIVDGFLISDNIDITYLENVQTGFSYSDHGPVVMKFKLQGE